MIPFFNVFYIKVLYHVAYVYLIIKVFSACERIEETIFFFLVDPAFFVTYVSSRVFWVLGAWQIFFCIVIRQKIMSSLDAALSKG
jgi:hypothetical protein